MRSSIRAFTNLLIEIAISASAVALGVLVGGLILYGVLRGMGA